MKAFILEDRTFGLSGEPSQLEYYECYHDPACSGPTTGLELLRLEETSDWDEDKASIWHYFYRPYNHRNKIAPVQKLKIQELNHKIQVTQEASSLNTLLLIVLAVAALFSIYPLVTSNLSYFLILFGMVFIYLLVQRVNLKSSLENDRFQHARFTREVDFLMDQKKSIEENRLTPRAAEELFWKRIRNFEDAYIEKTFGSLSTEIKADCGKFYSDQLLKDYDDFQFPTFPVIPSWALLQSSKRDNTGSKQITGLQIIADKLKLLNPPKSNEFTGSEKIATWRRVSKGRALYRVWYIQFLIFHHDNLELVSYYYDFVTNRVYSQTIEAYQYKHITDYTYADEDISYMVKDQLIKGLRLPEKLTDNIFGNEVKTISLNSASGSNYRCVIPDRDISDAIDVWINSKIEHEEAIIALQESPEGEFDYWANELLEIGKNYDGLIETLAWLSFKSIREKASKALRFSVEEAT